MIGGNVQISTKLDNTKKIEQSLTFLRDNEVLVGIPEGQTGSHQGITNAQLLYILTHGVRSKSMRDEMDNYEGLTPGGMPIMRDFQRFSKNTEKMSYSAAYELYIHEHGSPLWRIPPRPVLEPAIEHNKESIALQLKMAAQAKLNGKEAKVDLNKAGQHGVNVTRNWFYNPLNKWPKNAPGTIKQKHSDRPNVDTGNLRNAITYVVVNR